MAGARTFGDRVTRARWAQELTQAELAEAAGISRASVANYERNVQEPRADKVEALAAALGVPAGWLRDG